MIRLVALENLESVCFEVIIYFMAFSFRFDGLFATRRTWIGHIYMHALRLPWFWIGLHIQTWQTKTCMRAVCLARVVSLGWDGDTRKLNGRIVGRPKHSFLEVLIPWDPFCTSPWVLCPIEFLLASLIGNNDVKTWYFTLHQSSLWSAHSWNLFFEQRQKTIHARSQGSRISWHCLTYFSMNLYKYIHIFRCRKYCTFNLCHMTPTFPAILRQSNLTLAIELFSILVGLLAQGAPNRLTWKTD